MLNLSKLNILLISTACAPTVKNMHYGGIEKVLGDFVDVLHSRGHQLTVAAPIGSAFPEGVNNFPTVQLPEQAWNEILIAEKLFSQRLIPDGFDIIHDFSHQKRTARISHGFWAKPYPFLFMLWHPPYYFGMKNAIHEPPYNLCGIAKWQAEGAREIYNQEVKWAHLGIDTARYALQKDKSDRYLFLSAPLPQKGGVEAIQMAQRLGLKLDLVCGKLSTEPDAYENQMRSLCDGVNIRYVGGVDEDEKIKYLQNAKALIFPVLQNEPFGLVMPEALSCGTPVFALNNGSPKEIVTEECGVVAKSLQELETRLGEFNAKTLAFQSDLCRARAVTFFDREVMVDAYLKLYDEVIAGRHWY